jgi:predicted nucleic acid-binding protein
MILVDTSIWIDHLHAAESALVDLLERDEVGCHPLVVEELALGSIKKRANVVELLGRLSAFPVLGHDEILQLVGRQRLWGKGLSAVDAHLLGSVALVPGAQLWTRDKRLIAAGRQAGIHFVEDRPR